MSNFDQINQMREEISEYSTHLKELHEKTTQLTNNAMYESLLELWHAHKCNVDGGYFLPSYIRDDFGQLIDVLGKQMGKPHQEVRDDMYPQHISLIKEADPEFEQRRLNG